jgi:hypothetical protein
MGGVYMCVCAACVCVVRSVMRVVVAVANPYTAAGPF